MPKIVRSGSKLSGGGHQLVTLFGNGTASVLSLWIIQIGFLGSGSNRFEAAMANRIDRAITSVKAVRKGMVHHRHP